jgi:hypothetical protein
LRNLPFYDQVPRKSDARDQDYQVVDARISKESAIAAVAEWERQFLRSDTRDSRVPAIAAALGTSFEGYRSNVPAVDPAAFRLWLETRTGDEAAAVALDFVREVGRLFRQIELLGLTSTELEVSKAQILFRVLEEAPGMRAGFLRRVIDSAPASSTPDGSSSVPRAAASGDGANPRRKV